MAFQSRIVQGIMVGIGGGAIAGVRDRLRDKLAEYPSVYKIYRELKEWSDALIGVAIIAAYEVARPLIAARIGAGRLIDNLVYSLGVTMISDSFAVLFGAPFVIPESNTKLYIKNISPLNDNTYMVSINGIVVKADQNGNLQLQQALQPGVYDIAVMGSDKASYYHGHVE